MEEYEVKAAFVYNFIKFVEWPADTFHSAAEAFTICMLGADPFGRSLQATVANHEIRGRSLSIRHISSLRQDAGCHVLFIGPSADVRPTSAAADTVPPGILTIGDEDSGPFSVIILFKLDEGKVRFEIDARAAARNGLRISSRLLSLALAPQLGRSPL